MDKAGKEVEAEKEEVWKSSNYSVELMLPFLECPQAKWGLDLPSPTCPVHLLLVTGILAFILVFGHIALPHVLPRGGCLTVLPLAHP